MGNFRLNFPTKELTPHISSPTQNNIYMLLKFHRKNFVKKFSRFPTKVTSIFGNEKINTRVFFTSEPLTHSSNLVGQLCAHSVHMAGQWDFLEWPSGLRDGKSGCLPRPLCHRLCSHPAGSSSWFIYIYIYMHTHA